MRIDTCRQKGFSLVELSIVLVILGLLAGGILGGQSLIKASELRAVSTEYEQWQTATNTFRERYFAVPGDFSGATSFWIGGVTSNGDGNGLVADGALDDEMFLFWQHLSLAGLIPGTYTGVTGSGGTTYHVVPEENAPRSRFGGGWTANTRYGGSAARYDYNYLNSFLVGAATATSLTQDPLFTPQDAWNVDTKFDDGKPGKGRVIGLYYSTCANSIGNQDYDKDYALNDDSVQCALYFKSNVR